MRRENKSSATPSRGLRLRAAGVLCGVLLGDLALGTAIFDDKTPASGRFDSSPAAGYDRVRAARVQDDGESARFVERDGLWFISAVSSETVNVDASGSRRTTGNRDGGFRVAFIGGSAAFGLGQGDDATVASEMARILNSGSAPFEVVNLGTPAWTMVDAARDLEARIAKGEKFDAVVSYSGANEMFMGILGFEVPASLVEITVAATGKPSDNLLEHWADRSVLARLTGRQPRPARTPLRIVDSTTNIGSLMAATRAQSRTETAEEMSDRRRLVQFNYAEGVRMIGELGAAHGFSVLHTLQPLKNDVAADTGALRSMLREIAPSAFDLAGIVPSGCFYDQVHTTEPCSADIAAAIVAEFRARGLDAAR